MQYENYERKVNKVVGFMKLVFKHLTKIIIVASVMIATTVALLATRGIIVSAETCPVEITYGEELGYSADAFISKVTYEYRPDGTEQWSTTMPKEPGVYNVRAVSKATFGYRYGDIETFTLRPKKINVELTSSSVIYGEEPTVTAKMAFDDELVCTEFIYSDDRTSAKANPQAVKALDSEGNDVSSRYIFEVTEGKILTLPRPIEITVLDQYKIYDGTALKSEEYELEGTLAEGDVLNLSFKASITNVGTVPNPASHKILNAAGEDVTSFYKITNRSGELTVLSREFEIETPSYEAVYDANEHSKQEYQLVGEGSLATGHSILISKWASIVNAGSTENSFEFTIVDEGGVDVTRNYRVNESWGKLNISKRPVTIETFSGDFTYDGTVHSRNEYDVVGEYNIVNGHTVTLNGWESSVDAGRFENKVSYIGIATADGDNVTDNYKIEYKWGYITVNKRPITVTSATETVKYSGADYVNSLLIGSDLVASDVFVVTEETVVRNAGVYTNDVKFFIQSTARDREVTDNYEITFTPGVITVEKRVITINSENTEFIYDGTDLYSDAVIVSGDGLADGEYTVIDERTTVRNVTDGIENRLTVFIYSGDDNVTENYDISYVYGFIKVLKRDITVMTGTVEDIYDGDELYHDTPDVYNLAYLHTYKVLKSASRINVGTTVNEVFEYDIFDADGVSVKSNYNVIYIYGNITVNKRPVTLETESASKIYDAAPLFAPGWVVSVYSLPLVSNHIIVAETPIGSRVEVGSSINTYVGEARIYDGEEDVSYNYEITLAEGILTVERRPITVVTGSIDRIYDAKDHYSLDIYADTSSGGYNICAGHYFEIDGFIVYNEVVDTENKLVFRITDGIVDDLSYNYDITYAYGKVKIDPRPITVYTNSIDIIYDGKTHVESTPYVNVDKGYPLCDSHSVFSYSYREFKNVVQDAENYIEVYIIATDIYGNSSDVTYNYTVTYEYGSVNISPRPIKLTTASYNEVYDGKDHTFDGIRYYYEFIVSDEYGYYTLCEDVGHRFVYGDDYVIIKNVMSEVENSVTFYISDGYEDVTSNYDIAEIDFGNITVRPRPIKLVNPSYNEIYDGKDHTDYFFIDPSMYVGEGYYGLCESHRFLYGADFVTVKDVMSEVENSVSFAILDETDTDVTENYDISALTFGKLEVRPRPIKLVNASYNEIYDGRDHTDYFFDDLGKYTDEGYYTLCFDELFGINHYIWYGSDYVVIRNVMTDVENAVSYAIYDENGNDVTANYDTSETEFGRITVSPFVLNISTPSHSWIYDGIEHSGFDFLAENELPFTPSDEAFYDVLIGNINYSQVTSIKNVGSVINSFVLEIYDELGEYANPNFIISFVSYGQLRVEHKHINVSSVSLTQPYDGRTLVAPYFSVTALDEYGTIEGHEYFANFTSLGITVPGRVINTYDYESFRIMAGDEDVSENYIVDSFSDGILEVIKRKIFLQSASVSKPYDGKIIEKDAHYFVAVDMEGCHSLVEDHIYKANFTGKQEDIGSSFNFFDINTLEIYFGDEEVSRYYEIVGHDYGVLEITRRNIVLQSQSAEKIYDGTPLTAPYFIAYGESPNTLLPGHTVLADKEAFTASIIKVGSVNNTFVIDIDEIIILDENKNDVTDKYRIDDILLGTLTVTKRSISLKSDDAEKVYDGTPLKKHSFTVTDWGNPLADGDYITAKFTGSIILPGTTPNTFDESSIRFFNSKGENVSDCYELIGTEVGTLTVTGNDSGNEGGGQPPPDISIGLPPDYDMDEAEGDIIFTITSSSDKKLYLKQASYGAFNGKGWAAAVEYLAPEEYAMELSALGAYIVPWALATYHERAYSDPWYASASLKIDPHKNCYVRPYYDFGWMLTNTWFPTSDSRVEGDASVPYETYYYDGQYYNRLDLFSLESGIYEYERAYSEFVRGQYLEVDSETRKYMQSLIDEQGFDASSANIITEVAEFIQNRADYNLKYNRELDSADNIAIAFLRDYREGVCQHYATAATLLFRTLGIPARYTVGYAATPVKDTPTDVSAAQAHAWVEVYIDGWGWVYVEVTGGSSGGSNPGPEEPEEPPKTMLEIKPVSIKKFYDGLPLYAENNIVIEDGTILAELIAMGYTYSVTVSGVQNGPGQSLCHIESFVLYDPYNVDVTADFEIILFDGTLDVATGEIKIYLYEKSYEYSGIVYGYQNYEYILLDAPEGLVLDIHSINISGKDVVSFYASDINGNRDFISYSVYMNGGTIDLSDQYRVVVVDYPNAEGDYEVFSITKRNIKIQTNSATKSYDGKALTSNGFFITFGKLPDSHYIQLDVIGSVTSRGSDYNYYDVESCKVFNERGEEVSHNFVIEITAGTLTVV